jgi:sarcosine oxidase, subunit alpha
VPEPIARSPVPLPSGTDSGPLTLTDESLVPKWRVFGDEFADVAPGTSRRDGDGLIWSVSPGEWTALGPRPPGDVMDLTHVRAMFRLTGEDACDVLSRVCALDLGDAMFPAGAAARTLVAGVATEIVRDDQAGSPSYLLLPSRSFGLYLYETLVDADATGSLRRGQPAAG